MKKPASKKKKKRSSRKRSQPESGAQLTSQSEAPASRSETEDKGTGGIRKPAAQAAGRKVIEKRPEKRKTEGRSPGRFISMAVQFLRESRVELKKVKWPTRKELLASTAMVIFLVLVAAIFLGVIDFGLIKIIKGVVG
jgi:preprotein translocase subunit SecE